MLQATFMALGIVSSSIWKYKVWQAQRAGIYLLAQNCTMNLPISNVVESVTDNLLILLNADHCLDQKLT